MCRLIQLAGSGQTRRVTRVLWTYEPLKKTGSALARSRRAGSGSPMHGYIHLVFKEMVLTDYGADKWDAVLAILGITDGDDAHVMDPALSYDDVVTVAAVQAVCEVLGLSWDDALRTFGGFFVRFMHAGKHLRMIQAMGDDVISLLCSVNEVRRSLCAAVRATAPHLAPPLHSCTSTWNDRTARAASRPSTWSTRTRPKGAAASSPTRPSGGAR